MRSRRLLYLGPQEMAAYHWLGGTLAREAAFPPVETGWRQFAHYLAQHSGSAFSLLVNATDEGFHVETIPYLRGADRRLVIERRLAQTFFNPPLGAALSLGHEKNRRKDERLLLVALNNPDFFQPWLDGIRAADAALSGIFSLPLVAPALFGKLRVPPEPCLLLSVQDQSIRQSFFEKGELRFSRLTLLQHNGIGELAQVFSAEAGKLQQYLFSQRLIGRGQPLVAHILAHPGAFEAIRSRCADTPALRFNVIDVTECARRIGLKTVPQDTRAEGIFLHLLATDPPGVQFAGEDLRHGFRIARIRSLLQGAGALTLAACLLLSGKYLFDARQMAWDAEALRNEAALARREYENIVETLPRVPVDNETLKDVIDRYLAEERRGAMPTALYQEISRALQAEPAIDIDRLEWKADGAESGVTEGVGVEIRPMPENGERVTVRGTLRPGAGATVRQSLAAFGRFVDALRANANLRVEILRSPFDIASGVSLRADGSRKEETPREFELLVIREIAP
ncbi:MAG: hypothetical protein LBD06_07370 [Candidatus Accumulibacter sp.]|jgi:hypothetical protein|nr:hypothetical protein [Accumulibacter sp.]